MLEILNWENILILGTRNYIDNYNILYFWQMW